MKKKPLLMISLLFVLFVQAGCITNDEPKPTIDDDLPTDLEDRSIFFTQNLNGGDYTVIYNEFNNTIKEMLPLEDLQTAWESLIANYGTLDHIESTFLTTENEYTVVYVACNFSTLGLLDLRYVYDDQQKLAGFQFTPHQSREKWNPPEYTKPEQLIETNYSIGNEPYRLTGTLTTPIGDGPYPVIIMLSGSGANDRDETIYNNKPFKDIAWGLASQGIATFRFDKRSLIYGEIFGQDINATVEEEYLEDTYYATDLLYNLTEIINTDQILLLGHSLGGQVAPEAAQRDNRIQGLIILATPARDLEDIYYEQYFYLYNLDGTISDEEQQSLNEIQTQVSQINNKTAPSNELILGVYPQYYYFLQSIPPIEIAENLTIPILVLQGERDYQVTPENDFSQWQKSFNSSERVDLKLYPNLNHLFMYGEGPPNNLEYQNRSHVSEEIITDISHWIQNNYTLPTGD